MMVVFYCYRGLAPEGGAELAPWMGPEAIASAVTHLISRFSLKLPSTGPSGGDDPLHGHNQRPVVVGCTMIDMHVRTQIDERFKVSGCQLLVSVLVAVASWQEPSLGCQASSSPAQWIERRDSASRAGEMSSEKLTADWAPPDDWRLKGG